jgi:hypothetical protein
LTVPELLVSLISEVPALNVKLFTVGAQTHPIQVKVTTHVEKSIILGLLNQDKILSHVKLFQFMKKLPEFIDNVPLVTQSSVRVNEVQLLIVMLLASIIPFVVKVVFPPKSNTKLPVQVLVIPAHNVK